MEINVIMFGGSGYWANKTYCSALLKFQNEAVVANLKVICDPINPESVSYSNTKKIVQRDKTLWLKPAEKQKDLINKLDELHSIYKFNAAFISCNPIFHFIYSKWALTRSIHVICDKPLFVEKDSSFRLCKAQKIINQFNEIVEITKSKNLIFSIPLRRRVNTAFLFTYNCLMDIFLKYNEDIRYMTIHVNGGIHKMPIEFMNKGAHGASDGVGTLSYSSYHYIDVICWFVKSFMKKTTKLCITLHHVGRVSDYIKSKNYKTLMRILNDNDIDIDINSINREMKTELDFTFNIQALDKEGNIIGVINYSYFRNSFSNRTVKYNPNIPNHGNIKGGGRMSHFYIDIHQGNLQNIQLIKNDSTDSDKSYLIKLQKRVHSYISKIENEYLEYKNAFYENTITPENLVEGFLYKVAGYESSNFSDKIINIDSQLLTMKMFAKFYEMIAKNYKNKKVVTDFIDL